MDQRGMLGTVRSPKSAKKQSVIKESGANTTQITNTKKAQEWFKVTDPIAKKMHYINSVTHQVLETPPAKETIREKTPTQMGFHREP